VSIQDHPFPCPVNADIRSFPRWWKAKIKPGEDVEDADKVGLVPSNYVEEVNGLSFLCTSFNTSLTHDQFNTSPLLWDTRKQSTNMRQVQKTNSPWQKTQP
jgi:hypothetical protein